VRPRVQHAGSPRASKVLVQARLDINKLERVTKLRWCGERVSLAALLRKMMSVRRVLDAVSNARDHCDIVTQPMGVLPHWDHIPSFTFPPGARSKPNCLSIAIRSPRREVGHSRWPRAWGRHGTVGTNT
jgi:hypothetical protein